jgi:hypothetical protein
MWRQDRRRGAGPLLAAAGPWTLGRQTAVAFPGNKEAARRRPLVQLCAGIEPSVRPIGSRYRSLTCIQNLESLAVPRDAVINEPFTVPRITLRLSCCLS